MRRILHLDPQQYPDEYESRSRSYKIATGASGTAAGPDGFRAASAGESSTPICPPTYLWTDATLPPLRNMQGGSLARQHARSPVKTSRSRRSVRMSDLAESGHSVRHAAMAGIRQFQTLVPLL
jgi:hypothetical protein